MLNETLLQSPKKHTKVTLEFLRTFYACHTLYLHVHLGFSQKHITAFMNSMHETYLTIDIVQHTQEIC
jgi:hypothetical protein